MRASMAAVLVAAMIVTVGCGSGSKSDTTASSSSTTQAAKAGGPPPAALIGSYTTTLTAKDAQAEATPDVRSQRKWLVKISKNGGTGNTPALTIFRTPPPDPLESPTLSVSGDTLTLSNEECAPSTAGGQYTTVTSVYRWKLDGKTLRLTTVKKGCPDRVAQTILTAEPLTKQ